MTSEIGEEHFRSPMFQEAYAHGLDLWANALDQPTPEERLDALTRGLRCVREEMQILFGFSEGDAEVIMQRTFRDIAEARGIIGEIGG